MVDFTKATNHQLKIMMNYDRGCNPYLMKQIVTEMLNRGILKDFIQYHSKRFFGTVRSREIKLGLEDSDIIQLGYIGILKALEKYREGESSFSSFSHYYIRAEWQNHLRQFNTIKRTMDRESISTDVVVNEEGDTLEVFLPCMADVEKTVLMKVYFESQLELLTPLQRAAVLGHMKGYQNREIAKSLNKPRQSVDRALKSAIEKMGGEAYTIKENCGVRKGA